MDFQRLSGARPFTNSERARGRFDQTIANRLFDRPNTSGQYDRSIASETSGLNKGTPRLVRSSKTKL